MRKKKQRFIAERAFVCSERGLLELPIYHPRSVCKPDGEQTVLPR